MTQPFERTKVETDTTMGAMRWSWATRLHESSVECTLLEEREPPKVGDLGAVEIESIDNHSKLTLADNRRVRLHPGDKFVGVFVHRYATDVYEARVESLEPLHVLTGAGMIGTVKSRHTQSKKPTRVRFLGYVTGEMGERVNLIRTPLLSPLLDSTDRNLVLVVGTGMNKGKTTIATKLAKRLLLRGWRVSCCKATGSVSERDRLEMLATSAHDVRDFSDYGFPSTFLCEPEDLLALFGRIVTDAQQVGPDCVLVELADGILQRETKLLLSDEGVRRATRCVILAASCGLSAVYGVEILRELGHDVVVSGLITNSPLFSRELREHAEVPIGSSSDSGEELAELVTKMFERDR